MAAPLLVRVQLNKELLQAPPPRPGPGAPYKALLPVKMQLVSTPPNAPAPVPAEPLVKVKPERTAPLVSQAQRITPPPLIAVSAGPLTLFKVNGRVTTVRLELNKVPSPVPPV